MLYLRMAGRLATIKSKGLPCSVLTPRHFSGGGQAGGRRGWRDDTPAGSKTEVYTYTPESSISWPDPKLGVLGSSDPNFSLPGHIGTTGGETPALHNSSSPLLQPMPDVLSAPTNRENQVYTLYNANDYIKYTPGSDNVVYADILSEYPRIMGAESLQFGIHDTPLLLRKEMQQMFPAQNSDNLTTITFSQKTENDMSKWSEEIEAEREKKTESFVQAAKEICGRLKEDGFWADFIDPCSGTPYYSEHTNTTMFETDDKYRLLGFRIEDLGCCKVILHPEFGRNVYVGCIITNAGKNSTVLDEALADVLN